MARPSKCRKVRKMPTCSDFFTEKTAGDDTNHIVLNVDEYETIRLIDYLGLTQEQCAEQMEVARATVQAVYSSARTKLSRFLVEGTRLKIDGGHYELHDSTLECTQDSRSIRKGEMKMKIAVTYADGMVFQHFGHTERFKIYTVEEGKVVGSEVVNTNGSGHGALSGFLKDHGVDVLICGGIGGGARVALAEAGIKLFPGAMGNADAQVESLLAGNLAYNPDTVCNHHHDHGEGHDCGSHGHGHDHECGGHCHH